MKCFTIKDLALLLFAWTVVLTGSTVMSAHEKDQFRVYDRNFKATDMQMKEMLKRANLESRGFTKITSSHLMVETKRGSQLRRDVHFTKEVPCSQLPRVEREVRSLLPGIWGDGVSSRVQDISFLKSLQDTQMCTAGIEIHFPTPGCKAAGEATRGRALRRIRREIQNAEQQGSHKKRAPRACPDWCVVCFLAQTEQ